MPFKPSRPLMCLLMCSAAGVAGCQTAPPPLTLTVIPSLRAPCERPDPAGVTTVADLAAFSLRQDGAISACDRTRQALVELIAAQTAIVTPPRPWWKLWPRSSSGPDGPR